MTLLSLLRSTARLRTAGQRAEWDILAHTFTMMIVVLLLVLLSFLLLLVDSLQHWSLISTFLSQAFFLLLSFILSLLPRFGCKVSVSETEQVGGEPGKPD